MKSWVPAFAGTNGKKALATKTAFERERMVDATLDSHTMTGVARRRTGLRRVMQRKSTIAFLMTLPLIAMVALLVIYPAVYSLHLSTLNKSMERFVGFGNFTFLFKRETFWMVVKQSCIFAITAVIFKR
jgi:multiple sugar transport system permease protein